MQDFDPCQGVLTWVDNLCRHIKLPPPTKNKDHKHQSAKDRAHNRTSIRLDITNIDLPNIDSLHNFNSLPNSIRNVQKYYFCINSYFIKQFENLSHVVLKQEVEHYTGLTLTVNVGCLGSVLWPLFCLIP